MLRICSISLRVLLLLPMIHMQQRQKNYMELLLHRSAQVLMSGGFISNLVPVTIGNILGGMVFVALPLYVIHKKKA